MFFPLIEQRRSIRRYLDQPVEKEKIDKLIEAALRAPSSRGFKPWKFILVTDKNLLEKLSRAKPHGSSFLKNAPLGIVVLADAKKCDVWVEDASIASIFIQLAAQALGLGSCWIQIRKRMHNDTRSAEAYIADLLQVPDHLRIESIVAAGYSAEQKAGHAENSLQYEKVFINKYLQAWKTDKEDS